MKRYILVTPPYSKSAGVRVLHKLADTLLEKGYEVLLFSHAPYLDNYIYITEITDEMRKDDIVIYPETVRGNPLKFQNVVRYVLYTPGKLGGEESFYHAEKIFVHEHMHVKNAPTLYFSVLDTNLFYDNNSEKKHDAYFIYKGGQGRIIPELKDAVRIDMTYPESRQELADILRKTKRLYVYDSYSILLDEALLCGAEVKIITDTDIIDYVPRDVGTKEKHEADVNNFIKITQEMNYTGDLQLSPNPWYHRLMDKYKLNYALYVKDSKKIYKYRLRY